MQPEEVIVGQGPVTDDIELIRLARRDNAVAWETLVRQHEEAVFRLAYLILGDAAEAEDVAQETFVRAWRHLNRFDTERPLKPWLLSISANLSRNRRRSLGRYWAALQRTFQAGLVDTQLTAEQTDATDARRLREAVQRLRPPAQDVVYLRYFLGLSETEAAGALNIPAGTAKSRLSRALAQLRRIIETDYPDLRDALGSGS